MERVETDTPAFAGAIYLATVVIIFTNFVDLGAAIWPWRPGDAGWRYGAAGLTGGFLLTPLMGVVLTMTYASMRRHRAGMLVFTGSALLLGILVLLLVPLFILDAIQMRANVTPELVGPFQFGIAKALFKLVTAGSALVLCGLVGVRWFRQHRPASPASGKSGGVKEGLVVGS